MPDFSNLNPDKEFLESRDYHLKDLFISKKIDLFAISTTEEYMNKVFPELFFENCTIEEVTGPMVHFMSNVKFKKCRINSSLYFHGAVFHGVVQFEECELVGTADFSSADLLELTLFDSNVFKSPPNFHRCRFNSRAIFIGNQFLPWEKIFESGSPIEKPSFWKKPIVISENLNQ